MPLKSHGIALVFLSGLYSFICFTRNDEGVQTDVKVEEYPWCDVLSNEIMQYFQNVENKILPSIIVKQLANTILFYYFLIRILNVLCH